MSRDGSVGESLGKEKKIIMSVEVFTIIEISFNNTGKMNKAGKVVADTRRKCRSD